MRTHRTALFVVPMYPYHPRLLASSNIEKQYISHCVNDACNGAPSRIRWVRLISCFGATGLWDKSHALASFSLAICRFVC